MRYKDATLPVEERVADLLSRMNLDEKVAQLSQARMGSLIDDLKSLEFSKDKTRKTLGNGCAFISRIGAGTDLLPREMAQRINQIQRFFVEETRLGIPTLFMTEATSGAMSRNHTLFPQNIGVGAMFNEEIVFEMGNAVREEMVATGERIALAPVLDLARDFRFGRAEECFGEDVYLASRCGAAYTRGLQSDDLKNGIAATLKHFTAQGSSDGGRNCNPVHAPEREILDQYAVPFEAAVQEGQAACVMAAYHELDGIPCHASKKVLTEILRGKLGFEGLLMSDGNGIQLIKTLHEYCQTLEEAVPIAMAAGIECELDHMFATYLKSLCERGLVDIGLVDRAVAKVLALKFNLGLFDNPYVDEKRVETVVGSEEHLRLSTEMARQSMTLLKNKDGILPLSKEIRSIAVVGPLADQKEFAYGDYAYPVHIEDIFCTAQEVGEEETLARTLFFKRPGTTYADLFHNTKTVYQAIKEKVSPGTQVFFAQGLKDTTDYHRDPDFFSLDEAAAAAAKADVVVAVCGDTCGMGRDNDCGESVDRADIRLSPEQRRLLAELKKQGKPVILVLCNARPLELFHEDREMDAILEAWKPGYGGADAIAEVLFGETNPAGRLPVSLPKKIGQMPLYYSQHLSGKKQSWHNRYLEVDLRPLYPFGYGLSYTTFSYESVSMVQHEDRITVQVVLRNDGPRDGEEVVQVYARKRYTTVLQPERELKAFKRVFVEHGKEATVEFDLLFDSLCYHNVHDRLVLEDCRLDVLVGSSAERIHTEEAFNLKFEGGLREVARRAHVNPARVL